MQGRQAVTAPEAPAMVPPPEARRWQIWIACALVAAAKGCDPPLWVLRPAVQQEAFGAAWIDHWSIAGTSTVTLLVFIISGGVLGDMFGRRRVLLLGLMGFVLASGLLLLPFSPIWFPITSALLGVGGSLMLPLALANIRLAFNRQRLPIALALYAAVTAITSILVTVLGPIVSASIGWRAVYVLPFVVGAIALVACRRIIPESRAEGGYQRRDSIGISAWSLVILAVTYAAITVQVLGTTSPVFLSALGVAALGGGFLVWWERHAPSPILRHLPYSAWVIAIILLTGMMLNFALMGFALQLYNFFRWVKNYGPVLAALALAPGVFGVGLAIFISTRLARRSSSPVIVFGGLVVVAATLIGTAVAAITLRTTTPYWLLALFLTTLITGYLVASTAWMSMYLTAVPRDLTGVSAAISNGTNQLGAVLASTLLGTLFVGLGHLNYSRRLQDQGFTPKQITKALEALSFYLNPTLIADQPDLPPTMLQALVDTYRESYAYAFGMVLLIAAALLVLCIGAVWFGLKSLRHGQTQVPGTQENTIGPLP